MIEKRDQNSKEKYDHYTLFEAKNVHYVNEKKLNKKRIIHIHNNIFLSTII